MPRILIADDHAIIRRYVGIILLEQNWEVCGEAANGRQAVAMTTEHRPDIVVLDLSMPEMNGLEAAREIHAKFPETELIILTMHDAPDLLRAALDAGVRTCVSKGELQDLVVAIREVLQNSPALRHQTA